MRMADKKKNKIDNRNREDSYFAAGRRKRKRYMKIKKGCFRGNKKKKFCNTADKKLRYFVNGTETGSISDYVPNENDRILVIYGDEDDNEIEQEIDALRQIPIQR